jgi:hypothetical protein
MFAGVQCIMSLQFVFAIYIIVLLIITHFNKDALLGQRIVLKVIG